MNFGRQSGPRMPRLGGVTSGMAPPVDLVVLLGVLFLTYSLRFFESTRVVPELLELTPFVWRLGFVWQLVTYPLAAVQAGGLWFLLSLLILFWFGRDVFYHLGRKRFWTLLVLGALAAALVAAAVHVLVVVAGGHIPNVFRIMQGQHMLLTLIIAAFATLYANATILLFFVLSIRARWFLWLEILFAFLAFLGSKDVAGFLGICAGVFAVWYFLQPRGRRPTARELWLRSQRWWLEQRMKRLRKKRGFRVVQGDGGGTGGGGPRGGPGPGGYLN